MAQIEFLTPADVRQRYGLSKSRLNRLVRDGRIVPTFDSGQRGVARLYSPESIESYLRTKDPRGRKLKDGKNG